MYLRVLHRDRPDTDDEATRLRTLLETITAVMSITRHPRGGFAVQCELRPDLLTQLQAAGYLSVV